MNAREVMQVCSMQVLMEHIPAIACESSPPPFLFLSYYFALFSGLMEFEEGALRGALEMCNNAGQNHCSETVTPSYSSL